MTATTAKHNANVTARAHHNQAASANLGPVVAKPQSEKRSSSNELSRTQNLSFLTGSSALSSNDSLQQIYSDVVGVKQRNSNHSYVDALSSNFSFEDVDAPRQDPADKYRSTEKVALEGYDQAKLDDPNHQTPKYLFGRVAQGFKLDSVRGDKAKAEELLKAMVPDLRAAGLEVVAVEGDRIQVKTEVGYEWVDVIRGAGGDKPGWWWGSEGVGTAQPTTTSKEWAAQTGQATQGQAGSAAPAGGGGAQPPQNTPLGNQLDKGKIMQILAKHKPTNEGMRAAEPELKREFPGVKILDHPKRLDKLQFASGAVVDVVVGAGGPSPSWGWMPEN